MRYATEAKPSEGGAPFPTWYRISGFLAIVTIALFLPWVITHGSGAVFYEGRVSMGVISDGHFFYVI